MTTEAGRRLLAIPLIDGDDAPLDLTEEVFAIESEARAAALREVVEKVERLDTWPRVAWFAYDPLIRGVPLNPTEERVVVDRAAVLSILTEATDRGQRAPAAGASE